ncbi:MAG: ThuA domain-containing protein [Planctomycetota bacterium]|nr:ThuA domain-containing protein [Planctomycetota bacterium]
MHKIAFLHATLIAVAAFSLPILTSCSALTPEEPENPKWLTYRGGDGPGHGKHIVLIAADQEYRSEESMPMLARILSAQHGYDCTVLFSVNKEGLVDPTMKIRYDDKAVLHDIPGIEMLDHADLMILFSRLITLPAAQIKHVVDYVDAGKPILAIRTANHGFLDSFPYQLNGKNVRFGEDVLGGSFLSHHGDWHADSTRGVIVEAQRGHPILTGVNDIWGPSDVYRTYPVGKSLPADCTALVYGQPLLGRNHDGKPNPEKEPLPVAWTKTWTGSTGKPARVFHLTMGSSYDFKCKDLRRLTINGAYWCLSLEDQIRATSNVDYLGPYAPLDCGFDYAALGVIPRTVASYR